MDNNEPVFTSENVNELKTVCEKIISILNENVEGELMISQKMMLAERIKDFSTNEIIAKSGIL